MRPVRPVVSLLLLFAIGASSVQVVFGDTTASQDTAGQSVRAGTGDLSAGDALTTVPDESRADGEECPCLCDCACVGTQLVITAVMGSLPFWRTGVEVPAAHIGGTHPLRAPRPHFRPPLP